MANDYVPDVSPVSGIPAQQTYFLGRYRIIDEIGLGGMASVHLARVDGLGGFQRWFAIKRIHAHLVEDETFVNMFLDEANVAARIQHPNVATVFELGRHDDTYWIAMEYLHGEPLREVMRLTEEMGATMPPEIACRVIAEAADGLHAAHELVGKDGAKLNLIHRDVTPHNLFVTYEGVTKVVDFGIAKFQDRMASTQAGTLKGKLAYMSPEQVQGESIDRRTDIFALGVVLWELTTGQRLFRMDSDLDTLAKVQECNIPPPSTMVRGYPLDLEKILMQALAKNREDRFPTAREFSRALQSLLTRRGLFIANDEVAAYMASIFVDRIAKREEHLRWASAVSDAASAAAAAASPAEHALRGVTGSRSALPQPPAPAPAPARPVPARPAPAPAPAAARGAPRPAAGAPARPAAAAPPSYNSNGPASMTASEQQQIPRGPAIGYGAPAGSAPARGSTLPPPPPRGNVSYPIPGAKAPPPPPPDDDDEDRTVQATVAQQAAAQAGYNDDYDDDGDATIVSRAAPSDALPPSEAFRAPAILPAAGAPARPPAYTPPPPQPSPPARGPGGVGGRTMPLSAVAGAAPFAGPPRGAPMPQPRTQMGLNPQAAPFPPPPQQQGAFPDRGIPQAYNISDPALPQNGLGAPQTRPQQPWGAPMPAAPPPPYGPPPQMGSPFAPAPQQPSYAQNGGYAPGQFGPPAYVPPPSPAFAVTAVAPPDATGAQNAIRQRRVPAWAVAVASALIALVLTGGAVLIYAISRSPHNTGPRPTGSSTATAGSSSAGSPAQPGQGGGVFAAARAGFLAAATPPPLTANSPDSAPTATATATAAPPPSAVAVAAQPDPPAPAPAPPPPAPAADPAPVAVATRPDPPPQRQQTYYPPAPTPTPSPGGGGGSIGYLSVICIPGCDRVDVDGQSFGASPVFKKKVPVGQHRIKLTSSNPPGTKVVSATVVADSVKMVRESMP